MASVLLTGFSKSADSLTPNLPEQTLSKRESIFQELARKTCKVIWRMSKEVMETSGCFVKAHSSQKIQVLSCFYDDSWSEAVTIQIIYQGTAIYAKAIQVHSIDHDLCILDFEPKHTKYDCFHLTGVFDQPSLGQKIYFAGFPFGTRYPVVHKGYISSVQKGGESDQFTMDGTVVQGHSGGPVVFAGTTELKLVGIISSQLCDISKKFIELSNAKLPSIVPMNDAAASFGNSDIRAVLKETMDCILANFSTGIGKATCLTNISKLKESEVSEQEEAAIRADAPGDSKGGFAEKSPTDSPRGMETAKEESSLPSSEELEDDSASMAFASMQGPDLWMQHKGIGGSSSSVSKLADPYRIRDDEKSKELRTGKKNRFEQNIKRLKKKAAEIRKQAKKDGSFKNNGLPAILYRFVSQETAKSIKKIGIVHSGTNLDEIPFITEPEKSMAVSAGAVSTEAMIAVFTDWISGLTIQNVNTLKQQRGAVAYKINMSIPKEAIEILEA